MEGSSCYLGREWWKWQRWTQRGFRWVCGSLGIYFSHLTFLQERTFKLLELLLFVCVLFKKYVLCVIDYKVFKCITAFSSSSHNNSRPPCLCHVLYCFLILSCGFHSNPIRIQVFSFSFNRWGRANVGRCAFVVSVRSYSAFHQDWNPSAWFLPLML